MEEFKARREREQQQRKMRILKSILVISLTVAGVVCGWLVISGQQEIRYQLHPDEAPKTLWQIMTGTSIQ